jgi:hypothetical protein
VRLALLARPVSEKVVEAFDTRKLMDALGALGSVGPVGPAGPAGHTGPPGE